MSPKQTSSQRVWSPPPVLKEQDIRYELERLTKRQHRSNLVALYGFGEPGQQLVNGQQFEVIPTKCELEMRRLMPLFPDPHSPGKVFLVSWTSEALPLDLACRLAGGRIYQVSKDTRLAGIFGARSVDPRLHGTALASILLSDTELDLKKISGQILRYEDAYRRYLHARLKFPLDGDLNFVLLVPWCIQNTSGPGFERQCLQVPGGETLRAEILGFIEEQTGVLGRIAWLAWEKGQGQRFLELCLQMEALYPHLSSNDFIYDLLQKSFQNLAPGWGTALLTNAGELVDGLSLDKIMNELFNTDLRKTRMLLHSADTLLESSSLRRLLAESPRLPRGFEARLDQLANALLEVAHDPVRERMDLVLHWHYELEKHRIARDYNARMRNATEPTYESLQQERHRHAAVRLAAYLVERTGRKQPERPGASYQEALELAATYAREGGYVDWLRNQLRDVREGPFSTAVNVLLKRVNTLCQDDDRHFAEGLIAWLNAGQPAHQVISLQDVGRSIIAPFLDANPHRKLLVVLLEGLNWSNAAELLASLEDEPDRWAPVHWRPATQMPTPLGSLPPVLATVPTLTYTGRDTLFSGKASRLGKNFPDPKIAERWANHRQLRRFGNQKHPVPLLSHEDVVTSDGLSQAYRNAISIDLSSNAKDSDASRLAVVQLSILRDLLAVEQSGYLQTDVESLEPLQALLSEAAANEWAVLLLSTHGHVPGYAMEASNTRTNGEKRWRLIQEGEPLHSHELRLPPQASWLPRGAEAVAACWDRQHCDGTPRTGEWGGISLAEVVVPALLIASESLAEVRPGNIDEGLQTLEGIQLDWWHLQQPAKLTLPTSTQQELTAKENNTAQQMQLPIEDAVPLESTIEERTQRSGAHKPTSEPKLLQDLRQSKVFKYHSQNFSSERVNEALQRLSVLVAGGDRLPTQEFAKRCGVRSYRVNGVVSRLSEVLNLDGYTVIENDLNGHQVILHRDRLCQLFEVQS